MRKIKYIYLILMLVGALLGPTYWFYEKLYSGEVALTMALTTTGDGSYTTQPFKLDASMQPAGLIFLGQGHIPPTQEGSPPPTDIYLATLYKDGVKSQSIPFPLTAGDADPVFKERLLWLKKLQGADYRLEIRPARPASITLERPRIEIRAGVQEPNNLIATAGFMLLIFGFLMLFLG